MTRAGGAKVMLLALAEHADQSGYCFPGLRRLATMCEVSESTARRMIKLLASRGFVTVERRFNKNGSCRSNGYRLAICDDAVKLTGRGVSMTGGKESPVKGHGVARDRETTTEPISYKEPLQPAHRDASTERAEPHKCPNGGPLCFPTVLSEAQREATRAQLAVLNHDDAQRILDELAGRMNSTRIRSPVGYCARLIERLKRGQFEPHAGLAVARQRQVQQREQCTSDGITTARMVVNDALDLLPESLRSSLERARLKRSGKDGGDATKKYS